MYFELKPHRFDDIVEFYNRHGFVVLTDVDPALPAAFRKVLTDTTGLTEGEFRRAGAGETLQLSAAARQALARPVMTPALRDQLFATLGDLVVQLLGPFVHVSNSYHPQIKRAQSEHILKGYSEDGAEVEAPYGLHQDFTAARLLTSPNAIVCWIPVNTCDYNALRVYTDTVQRGMLTNRWLRPEDAGDRLGPSVEVQGREGHVLLFNFQVMHGTTRPGPATRISCDARFFPFCGILDSEAMTLRPDPVEWIRERLRQPLGDTIAAPLYETLAYMGEDIKWPAMRDRSTLNWARVVEGLVQGDSEQMRDGITRLANTDEGFDPLSSYVERFEQLALCARPYRSVLSALPADVRARCLDIIDRATAVGVVPA